VCSIEPHERKGRAGGVLGGDVIEERPLAGRIAAPAPPPLARHRAHGKPRPGNPLRLSVVDALEHRRAFVLLPLCLIAGLVAYASLPAEPAFWVLGTVAAVLVCAAALLRHRAVTVPLLLASFSLGLCLLPVHGTLFGTTMLVRPAYGLYQVRIDAVLANAGEDRRIIVSNITSLDDSRPVPINRARLVVGNDPPLAAGDFISAQLRLAPVPGPILPGAYDGQFHSYFDGIGAYGNVTSGLTVIAHGSSWDGFRAVEHLRSSIAQRIDSVLSGDTAAIAQAMTMGDQSALSDETRDVMAASGLAHIYSISGLHLSIIAGGVFWLLRLALASWPGAAVRLPVKKLAALAGITAALGYMLLAGGITNVPALRSTIMLALIFGAVLAGRRALTMRNVAIAALVIILLEPASVFRASFQLSFAAVIALIGIYEMPRKPPIRGESGWGRRLWMVIWTTAITSFIAGSATLLFSAYHFQQTAPLGVIGNVLVLPVVSLLIMPFGLLGVLAMPLGVDAPFLHVMGWGIDKMVDGAVLVAGWSAGFTGNPLLASTSLLLGLGALAWFAFVRTWWRLAGPLVAIPVVLVLCFEPRPDILVADTTQSIAVRDSEEFGLITGRVGSFAVDAWSDHYQEEIVQGLKSARCDSLGCIVETDAFSLAAVKSAAAFAEDCGRHDLLITRLDAPSVCGGLVIDADELERSGVHWLHWNAAAGQFDVRTAIPNVTRPWRVWLP
jgi:competence protein ComEC